MKTWTIVLGLAAAAGVAGIANAAWFADGGHAHSQFARWFHGGGEEAEATRVEAHLDALAAELALTLDQRRQVAGVLGAELPNLQRSAKSLADAHARQFALATAPELDEAAVAATADELGAASRELSLRFVTLANDVHRVFTPEQRERLRQLHQPASLAVTEHVRECARGVQAWAARQ
ncbi:MAG: Spy/CpxP family protein refolding chaperone [Planctomycetes bacterium]|nr:Spy/CpxP family protein refolding chaperone [Planctomycetota bacterium]